jgi:Protein of unknown function (DUF3253)
MGLPRKIPTVRTSCANSIEIGQYLLRKASALTRHKTQLDAGLAPRHLLLMQNTPIDLAALESSMLALVAERGPDKTICPSDVARAVGGGHPDQWGPLMQPIRRIAVRLAHQKGKPVDPEGFKGVYRLGLPRQD